MNLAQRLRQMDGRSHKPNGQAIVLVAFLFIGLVAATGLVVDVATVLTRYSQLRRAIDAAGIQAAYQFRESRVIYSGSGGDLFSAVQQILAVQGFVPTNTDARIFACANPGASILSSTENSSPPPPNNGDYSESDLRSQLCMTPPRKLLRVDAQTDVGLPFLSIIGWRTFKLKVTTVGEAASLDLALVLDRSRSMTSDTCNVSNNFGGYGNIEACAIACAANKSCSPFEHVRANAVRMVERLKFPYDHVTIIQFDRDPYVYDTAAGGFVLANPATIVSTMMIEDKTTAINVLNNSFSVQTGGGAIPGMVPFTSSGLNTNIGGGIRTATRVLTVQGRRRASVWVTVFLTDGAPNATDPIATFTAGVCPPTSWPSPAAMGTQMITITGYTQHQGVGPYYAEPTCLNIRNTASVPLQRTCMLTGTLVSRCGPGTTTTWTPADPASYAYKYDPDDYARDQADYMASNGIVSFVIGLGPLVTQSPNQQRPATQTYDAATSRDPAEGERLLRYIADMGYDPDAKLAEKQWPCKSNWAWNSSVSNTYATGVNCGNYWYAATGAGLKRVFEEIASRMFTRLQQ